MFRGIMRVFRSGSEGDENRREREREREREVVVIVTVIALLRFFSFPFPSLLFPSLLFPLHSSNLKQPLSAEIYFYITISLAYRKHCLLWVAHY